MKGELQTKHGAVLSEVGHEKTRYQRDEVRPARDDPSKANPARVGFIMVKRVVVSTQAGKGSNLCCSHRSLADDALSDGNRYRLKLWRRRVGHELLFLSA